MLHLLAGWPEVTVCPTEIPLGVLDADEFPADGAVIAHPYGDDPFVVSTREKAAILEGLGGGYRLYRGGTVVALAGLAVIVLAMTGAFVPP